jgi:DNA primase
MDVVSLHQHGVTQAVATLGTATTKDHAELLFRSAPDVVFCFDGDRAGRAAAWRAVESVLPRMKDGRQAFFVFLPEGEDPDSLVRKEGLAGIEQRFAEATPLSEFFFAHMETDTNLATADGRARLAERCKALIEVIPDGAFLDAMKEMLRDKTKLKWSLSAALPASVEQKSREILDEANNEQTPSHARATHRPVQSGNAKRSLVRSAIALLLQQPALVQSLEPPYLFGVLRQPGVPLLIELIGICRARPDIGTGALLDAFDGREEQAALQKLALMDFPAPPDQWKHEFVDAIAQLNKQTNQQRIDELLEKSPRTAAENDELRACLAAKTSR